MLARGLAATLLLVSPATCIRSARPLPRTVGRAAIRTPPPAPLQDAVAAPEGWLRPVPVAAAVLGAALVCAPSAAHAAVLGGSFGDGAFLQWAFEVFAFAHSGDTPPLVHSLSWGPAEEFALRDLSATCGVPAGSRFIYEHRVEAELLKMGLRGWTTV